MIQYISDRKDKNRPRPGFFSHAFSWPFQPIKYLIKTVPVPVFFLVLVFGLTGCGSEPFPRSPLPVLQNPDPRAIRENFPQLLPEHFTSDDTVVLEAPFNHKFAVLGVLSLDRKAGTFELYGLNQLGVVFFHVGGDPNGVAIREAVPPLMEHKDILLSMARDIQRIYFNLSPGPEFKVDITSTQVVFTRKKPDGKLTYRFGYEPSVLFEKQLGGCFGATWRVRYYDYDPGEGGKLFPHGIVMDNFEYHYRIIIKNRDWSVSEQ